MLASRRLSRSRASKGDVISGLDAVPRRRRGHPRGHGGGADGEIVTAGGRVLNVTALGDDPAAARDAAYAAADMIAFDGPAAAPRHRAAGRGARHERARDRQTGAGRRETELEAEFDELEVDAPRVGIIMGSKSDMAEMEKAAKELEERGHPLRDPRDVGPPRPRHGRRLRQERAACAGCA